MYEPHDYVPLSDEEIDDLLRQAHGSGPDRDAAIALLLDEAIPQLRAELRGARAEIERLRALPTRQEYVTAVGGKQHPDDCTQVWRTSTPEEALTWARNVAKSTGGRAWVRDLTVHPWVDLSAEPPF